MHFFSPSAKLSLFLNNASWTEKSICLSGAVDLVSVVRYLTALEDSLGSLGPQVNQILARALSLEQNRDGASRILLEDPDMVSVLDLVKEKLAGQMVAGLLAGSRANAVRVALDHLTRLLQTATKKRSLNALGGSGGGGSAIAEGSQLSAHRELGTEEAIKLFIAKSIATVLVTTDRAGITDDELESLVEETMRLMASDYTSSSGSSVAATPSTTAVGRVARSYTETVDLERQLLKQQEEAAKLAAASLPFLLSAAARAPTTTATASTHSGASSHRQQQRAAYVEDDDDGDVDMPAAAAGPAYITPMYTGHDAGPPQVPVLHLCYCLSLKGASLIIVLTTHCLLLFLIVL